MVTVDADAEHRELREAKALLETGFGTVEAAWEELVEAESLEALAAERGEDADALRAAFVKIGPPEPVPDSAPLVGAFQAAGRYWLEAALVVWLLGLGIGWWVQRPADSGASPPAAVNLDELGEGPLSPAETDAVAVELRSLLESDDTASLRLRVDRLVAGALPPLLREVDLPRHVADQALSGAAEDSAAAAFLTRWIHRERSRAAGDPDEDGSELVLRFDAASADLPPAALQAVAEFVREPDRLVVVVGSADRSGEAERTPDLALSRARTVAEIFRARGTPLGEVVVLARPAIAGPVPTAAGIAEPENRRVEVWVR